MSDQYDVVVIGTGPGGYVCAIRAAQLGLRTAVVEKRATHGGTCLNVGCIPSKALLHASEMYEDAHGHFTDMGIDVGTPKIDIEKLQAFKQTGVDGNVKGVEFLLKKNKVDVFFGTGRIDGHNAVVVTGEDGETRVETKNIVIATGSDVATLPGIAIDEDKVLSSTGALELTAVPEHMVVVGGGYIGLEMGSVWRRLGSKVTVVEYLDRITPGMDAEVSKQFLRLLKKQGIAFELGHKVTGVETTDSGVSVTVEPAAGGDAKTIEADCVLMSIGRTPYTEGLGLESVDIGVEKRGQVIVDDHFRTSVPNIYAIGDVVRGPMLAHKAEDEGMAVAEIIAGKPGHVNYDVIPGVVYTYPEVASVGRTEEDLKDAGTDYKVGKFPFTANGRAKVNHQTDGFVKILADASNDRVLGVHIIGPEAGNLIAEAAVAMEFGASSEDIARTCHAHPTVTEAVKEAALAVEGRAIHM